MAGQTMPLHGQFCWNDLGTTDLGAAKKFYTELLGWELKESNDAGMPYHEIMVGGQHIGGLYPLGAEQAGMPSQWMTYVAVSDVDDSARRVSELGGKVCVPPTDIPGTGRFCVVTDPTGANISLITLNGASS